MDNIDNTNTEGNLPEDGSGVNPTAIVTTPGGKKLPVLNSNDITENPEVYSRLGPIKYNPVRVRQNEKNLNITSKSGVAFVNKGERYYLPDYSADKDGNIGNFVEVTDESTAPIVDVQRLRKLVTGDIHQVRSLGELLSLVYVQYIARTNYFDAVDDAVNVLAHYNSALVEELINKSDQHYMFDIRWLKEFGLAPRIKDVNVKIYDNDTNQIKSTDDTHTVTWNAIHEVAVLTFIFIDSAEVSFIIYPAFEGLRTTMRLIRTRESNPLALYTDVHGNLHNIDFVKLVGDALRFNLDLYTAKYYGKYECAGFAPVGSGDVEEINNARFGKEFALSYINPHNIVEVENYLAAVKREVNGNQDGNEIEGVSSQQTS